MMKKKYRQPPKNILILKNRAMGDAILGLSSVAYIKSLFPEAKVTYAVPKWVFPLFLKVETAADEIIPLEVGTMSQWGKLAFELTKKKFDLIIELNQSGRTGKFFKLFKFLSRVPYIFHNHNRPEKKNSFILDQGVKKANIQRDLDACWSGAKLYLGDNIISKIPSFFQHPPKMKCLGTSKMVDKFQIILGVVATRESKMWPISYYHRLCQMILRENPDCEILIPLSSSLRDKKLEIEFKDLGKIKGVMIFSKPLFLLPNTLRNSKLYIGNDTGLKHICASLGVKTYTLFGIEDPREWHPYNTDIHKFFAADIPKDAYKYPKIYNNCLRAIKPEDIFNKIQFPSR